LLMLTIDGKIISRLWNAGILMLALGAMMASGSRGPVAVFGGQVLGVAALGCAIRAIRMRHLLPLVTLTLLAAVASVLVLNHQATDFFLRVQATTSDVDWRVEEGLFQWLDVIYRYPLGVGLGAGHQAVSTVLADIWPPGLGESELSRLAFELGLGLVFYVAF